MKKVLKYIGVTVLLLLVFGAGFFCATLWFTYDFLMDLGSPRIYSDAGIKNSISSRIGTLPSELKRLYFSSNGFCDPEFFIAFSAPNQQEYLEQNFNISLDSFVAVESLPDRVIKRGPDSWEPEFRDENWDLKNQEKLLMYKIPGRTFFYSPANERLYICLWWTSDG